MGLKSEQLDQARPTRSAIFLNNATPILLTAGAFITFTGHNYFDAKLSHFGLTAGALDISQGEVIANGVYFAVGGTVIAAWRQRSALAVRLTIAPVLILVYFIATRFTAIGIRLRDKVDMVVDRLNSALLRVCFLVFIATTAMMAGRVGGDYDAEAISSAVRADRGYTYLTATTRLCGIPIA